MSLRRKSCQACFTARRKCDLALPKCNRCLRNNKTCQYRYPNAIDDESAATEVVSDALEQITPPNTAEFADLSRIWGSFVEAPQAGPDYFSDLDLSSNTKWFEQMLSSSSLGLLGEPSPIRGPTVSWNWVADQLRAHPSAFVNQGATDFIHPHLYSTLPGPMRAAFGLAAVNCFASSASEVMLFKAIDGEVNDLLRAPHAATLVDELAVVQALVLYQIMRFFHSRLDQRIKAEQQEGILTDRSLRLLERAMAELPQHSLHSWESWVVAESIRRTVIVVYMLYGMNSLFQSGICLGLPTLSALPVSTDASPWRSPAAYPQHRERGKVIDYATYSVVWQGAAPRQLDPFEKILLVACQGLDEVEARSLPAAS